jgi:hypothetical protein
MLKLSLLFTLILHLIGPLPYIPYLLTTPLLLTTLLLLFIILSLKRIGRCSSSPRTHLNMASHLLLLEELP